MKVAICPNIKRDKGLSFTNELVSFFKGKGIKTCISDEFKARIRDAESVVFCSKDNLLSDVSFAITLGGDGTILHEAREFAAKNIPVLGINIGNLGFMAELDRDEIGELDKVISGDFSLDKRFMLDVKILDKNGEERFSEVALNEAVIACGSISKMLDLEVYRNGKYIMALSADGVIAATPTGSTAYAMSAGGSVMDPAVKAITVVPICPHSFHYVRPLIFSQDAILEIKNINGHDSSAFLTLDGMANTELFEGDTVKISKSSRYISLIRIKNREFYDILFEKLAERKKR